MVNLVEFPVIDMKETGKNIHRLRIEKQLSVRELQVYFGFAEPAAIYHWQRGDNLPSLDNMVALSKLLGVTIEEIVVLKPSDKIDEKKETQGEGKQCARVKTLLPLMAA